MAAAVSRRPRRICALIAPFVWKLAREGGRSIQAVTGYFYLAVIMAFSAVDGGEAALLLGHRLRRTDVQSSRCDPPWAQRIRGCG